MLAWRLSGCLVGYWEEVGPTQTPRAPFISHTGCTSKTPPKNTKVVA